jgi:hypothetical protein
VTPAEGEIFFLLVKWSKKARVMGKRQGGRGGGGHRDKRARGGGGGGGRGGGKGGTGWDARSSWPAAEKTSPSMESYYQMQEIVPDDQWLDFMAACRKCFLLIMNNLFPAEHHSFIKIWLCKMI